MHGRRACASDPRGELDMATQVEAFFFTTEAAAQQAFAAFDAFSAAYPLAQSRRAVAPLLRLNLNDWDSPFAPAGGR